jgi:serine/threonine-protein kinase
VALTKLVAVEGERLDRFELVAELASGGMATVYLARLSGVGGFQRFVAIKRLHPHLAKEGEFIQMFLDEARLAARIHHPNVVPILEIGTSADGYYLVMEYIEGDTLARLLARAAQNHEKIPPGIGVRLVLDTLAGLHAAHELKDDDGKALEIVHRDVSPQNVLVGVDGTARITDFGVARASSRLSTTRSGQLKGKLAYMAPEQAKAASNVDRRADVFAMGVVLWEILACKRLFKGDGEADTLNRVLHEPIPTLRTASPLVPAVLETVVMKALERDRDKRYATAADFSEALERAARVLGLMAAPREVAAYVEEAIGAEISQQRDAVRAWLTRSEPSKHGIKVPEPRDAQSETKVEGSGRRVDSQPSSVSSVSSAVVEIPGGTAAAAEPAPETVHSSSRARASNRSRTWAAAIVTLVAIGGVAIAFTRWQAAHTLPPAPKSVAASSALAPAPDPAPASAPAPAPAPASAPAPAPASAPAPSSAPSEIPTASASASAPRPRPAAPRPAPKPAPNGAPSPAPNALPDDISNNPYR